jgi:FKBP-type peptidyl-prolyl cis-trans isomerase
MIENGKYVVVHYTGSLEDGEVFDTSTDREPLEFQLGAGMVIPGFDSAVAGMKIDDEIDIVLPPAEAYGDYENRFCTAFRLLTFDRSSIPRSV